MAQRVPLYPHPFPPIKIMIYNGIFITANELIYVLLLTKPHTLFKFH